MKIAREDVLRVAELANLELSEAEVDTYLRQLDSILNYIGKLNDLDTKGVEPMAGGRPSELRTLNSELGASDPGELRTLNSEQDEDNLSLREDVTRVAGVAEAALRVAPDPKAPYFRVPKVIER